MPASPKSRRSRDSETSPGRGRSGGADAPAGSLAWWVFGPLCLVALALYFLDSNDTLRAEDLFLLLIPDEVLRLWVDGDWANFGLASRLGPTLVAAAWLLACRGLGQVLLRFLTLSGDAVERLVLELVAGLAAGSVLTLALGLAGWLNGPLFWGIAIGAMVAGWLAARGTQGAGTATLPRRDDESHVGSGFGFVGWRCGVWLAPLAAMIWLAACMPPWEFDVMAYHLQVPKEWLQDGSIHFLTHNVYGNMPLGAEMHPLATMVMSPGGPDGFGGRSGWRSDWFAGAIAGKLVIAALGTLSAAGVFLIGRRWLSSAAGCCGALLLLATPLVLQNATIGHNEMVIGCYGVLAWYAALRWAELASNESSANANKDGCDDKNLAPRHGSPLAREMQSWALLAGWFAGAAAACKYTAVVFVAAPLWCAVLLWGWRWRWRAAAWMLAGGVAAGGLWYAKNVAETGNPVYPLAYSVFGGDGWDADKSERWRQAHFAHGHSPAQLFEKLRRVGWKEAGQSPLLPVLALFALTPWGWPRRDDASDRMAVLIRRWAVVWLLLVGAIWWGVTHRLERFLLPSFPVAALLAGVAAAELARAKPGRRAMPGLLALTLLLALLVAARTPDARYLTGLDYLRHDPQSLRLHPTHRLINQSPDIPLAGQRVLMVADAQVFNLEKPIVYNSCFDDCRLTELVRDKSPAQRRQALHEAGISHVFVHWSELRRYREPGNYGFDEHITPELFAELVAQGVLTETLPVDQRETSSTLYTVLP